MKNPNALRPGLQELNESIRRPEHILQLEHKRFMLQPKFDGSFVFITRDRQTGETVFCTKDGNELRLDPEVQCHLKAFFHALTDKYIFEAELEPVPWTERHKVLLNGNLYSGKHMPFHVRVVLHDLLPVDEVRDPRTTARGRYAMLRNIGGLTSREAQLFTPSVVSQSSKSSICITPCCEVTREEAAQLFIDGWEAGKARRRVALGGQDYEGLVLINPESLHQGGRSNKWKVKPFHTVDLKVTQIRSSREKVLLHSVHGYDTKTGDTAKVTAGINGGVFQEISDAMANYQEVIVEVEVSSLRSLVSANPTFKGIRFDKMSLKNLAPSID